MHAFFIFIWTVDKKKNKYVSGEIFIRIVANCQRKISDGRKPDGWFMRGAIFQRQSARKHVSSHWHSLLGYTQTLWGIDYMLPGMPVQRSQQHLKVSPVLWRNPCGSLRKGTGGALKWRFVLLLGFHHKQQRVCLSFLDSCLLAVLWKFYFVLSSLFGVNKD